MWPAAGGRVYPILFEWPFTLHTFGVLVLLGAMAGLRWIRHECVRLGLDHEAIGSLAVEVFLAGLIGSRLFFVLINWETYAELPWYMPFNIRQGGLVWYGGPIAATPVALWRMQVYKVRALQISDIIAQGLVLGHAIGRIGCLMAGDDHGKLWTPESSWPKWLTVTFTDPNALVSDKEKYLGQPLLPSQLLMSAGKFTIFGVLVAVRKRLMDTHPGALAALYFALYSVERYLIELTRGDDAARKVPFRDTPIGDISTSQVVSLVVFPIALGIFLWFRRRPNPYAGLPPSPAAPTSTSTSTSTSTGAAPTAADASSTADRGEGKEQ